MNNVGRAETGLASAVSIKNGKTSGNTGGVSAVLTEMGECMTEDTLRRLRRRLCLRFVRLVMIGSGGTIGRMVTIGMMGNKWMITMRE